MFSIKVAKKFMVENYYAQKPLYSFRGYINFILGFVDTIVFVYLKLGALISQGYQIIIPFTGTLWTRFLKIKKAKQNRVFE
jgi:hypothetical protein